jgi:thymidine phosphorylase
MKDAYGAGSGESLGMHLEVLLTDGSQPIGRGIGPVLETRDVLQVLSGDPDAPADLREKALLLAGHILELDPTVRGGAGRRLAEEILVSGRALTKMQAIIEAQGRNPEPPSLGRLRHEVPAPVGGVVTADDNLQIARIARIARLAGAPMDQGAGVDLFKKLGDSVHAAGRDTLCHLRRVSCRLPLYARHGGSGHVLICSDLSTIGTKLRSSSLRSSLKTICC